MSGGFYGDAARDQVKAKVDIVALVGEHTVLKKAGADFTGCCPFHMERTPSFHVYPDEGRYHCFGCGAHGDCFDLVQESTRCDFREALEFLARRVGMVLTPQRGGTSEPPKAKREQLLAAVRFAQGFYRQQLAACPEATAYLADRGFTAATLETFGVGWAPGQNRLVQAAGKAGIDKLALVSCNLAHDRDDQIRDRFYDRVTFPILDRFGEVIGFTARLLPEAEAAHKAAGRGVGKYVNSSDTPLYHKSASIFNLPRARTVARTKNRILVMEGPTDVMAAHQLGYEESCACLGTAITVEQMRLLSQAVGPDGEVVMLLDGDKAGIAGARKAGATGYEAGVMVQVVIVPEGLDIAELLLEVTS